MNKKILFIPLVLFLILTIPLAVQLIRNKKGDAPTKLESVLIGKSVPEFQLESLLAPGTFYDQTEIGGEPLLINVWATWCATCYREHKFLNHLAEMGIKIIGINYKDDRKKAADWLEHDGNPYALTLFDGNGMFGIDLGVSGAPETYLVDANGLIHYRIQGDINSKNWAEVLEPMYAELLQEVKQ